MLSSSSFWSTFIKILVDIPYFACLLVYYSTLSLYQSFSKASKNLNGEIVLITGAASGLGQQVVWKLANLFPQATFVLWDINEEGLSKTAEKCQKDLGVTRIYSYTVDLSKRDEVEKAAEVVRQEVGHVTVLFNNAGLIQHKTFLESSPISEETVLKVNLLSYMWTIRQFLPGMIQQGRGHIICTSSAASFFRWQYLTSYTASKYGLRGFLESLKVEIRRHPGKPNIKFSTVYPGFINTAMTSMVHWIPRYDLDIFRLMDLDTVAERTVRGILREREEIKVPSSVDLLAVLVRCFPAKFVDAAESHIIRNLTVSSTQFNVDCMQDI